MEAFGGPLKPKNHTLQNRLVRLIICITSNIFKNIFWGNSLCFEHKLHLFNFILLAFKILLDTQSRWYSKKWQNGWLGLAAYKESRQLRPEPSMVCLRWTGRWTLCRLPSEAWGSNPLRLSDTVLANFSTFTTLAILDLVNNKLSSLYIFFTTVVFISVALDSC